MRSLRLRGSVAIAVAMVVAALPNGAAGQTAAPERCLDIEPELSGGRIGSPTYLIATLREKVTGETACNGPTVETGGQVLVDFELTGANDPDENGIGADSPESPDTTCPINPDYYIEARCVIALWGENEGVQTVSAWLDDDSEDPPDGIVEADRTEGADKAEEPGDGCVSPSSPIPSEEEPDCTDVVEVDWRHRPPCEAATRSGTSGRIAVFRSGPGLKPGMYTIGHDGEARRRLGAPEDLRDYLWSPDRKKLAVTTGYINSLELSVMRSNGDLEQLTDNFLVDEGAAWSPNSRKLVYASYNYRRHETSQLKLVRATGGRSKRLTSGESDSTHPDWAPNGNRIVYAQYEIGFPTTGAVMTMDADGGDRQTLVSGNTIFEYPQYSPDGEKVVFRKHLQATGARDLFMVDGGGRVERLTDSGTIVTDFQWSPDGRRIAYETTSDNGWNELRIVNADGSEDRRIARHFGLESWLSPSWSPDSSLISYQLLHRSHERRRARYLSDVWVSSVDEDCSQAITSTPDVMETSPMWVTPASTSNPYQF